MRRVLTFYKFVPINEPQREQSALLREGRRLALKGTILVAAEGINGTLVGPQDVLAKMQATLYARYGEFSFKWSAVDETNPGFYRYKVKHKPEIVSFGVVELDVTRTGDHVGAEQWNELLRDPDVLVIDTRNTYEVDIGSFPGAVSPDTRSFREFPQWVAAHMDKAKHKRVAMFCTGGIRCEKASAYLKSEGFDNVYQLDGGILNYLETVADDANQWQGECFVFDQRVSVTHRLEQGRYQQCFACRHPLSVEAMASADYEEGVSCPHCVGDLDPSRRSKFRERQYQVKLAQSRGEQHVGATQLRPPPSE